MNRDIMRAAGFGIEIERIDAGKCPICNKKIDMSDFRDQISLKEFKISGLCQKCQDETFGC